MNKRVVLLRDVFCKPFKKQITQLFLIGAIGLIPVSAFAQAYQVTMKKSNAPLSSVIAELEKDSGYTFFYNDDQINLNKKISIDVTDASLETVLNQLFRNTDYSYRIVNNQIVISKTSGSSRNTMGGNTSLQQKSVTVKGIVKDTHGEPVIGASVVEAGTTNGTVTDFDGNFVLTLSGRDKHMLISYIGYATKKITLKEGQTSLNVILEEDSELLDEVVVVGYGTQKKVNLTGAVAAISSEDIKDRVQTNVLAAVQGTVPGVTVISRPGQTPSINFRGRGNLGTSSPLYVIDGIISSSGLDGINPSDIQSMEILKDASSTAIYGSRGSNGVILITTKQGSEGKAQVTFDASVGLSTVRKQYDLLNAYEYATALNDIRGSSTISAEDLEAYKNGTKGINWTDLLTRTGITQDYRLAISGGNEKVKYLISGNVLDQEAITIMSDYKRYGIRANIDSEVKPWLTISAKLNASSLHKHNEGGANWLHVTNFSPTMELKDPETGVYNTDPYNMIGSSPYGEMIVNNSDSYSYNLNANLTLLFKIMKGLTLSVQGGYDYDNSPSYSFRSKLDSPGAINSASNTNALHNYWQNTNNLTWQKQFGDHSFTAMGVWRMGNKSFVGLTTKGNRFQSEQ